MSVSVCLRLSRPVEQASLDREKMERGAAERQLADRVKELNELRTKFDAYSAETNVRLATQFDTSRQNRPMHWRRQLWGTGARAPLDLQQFIFSLHYDLYEVWQRLYCRQLPICLLQKPSNFDMCPSWHQILATPLGL